MGEEVGSGWSVPLSPEPLVQERPGVRGEPWRLLVVCILCNKTRGASAWPVVSALFDRWPTPAAMGSAGPEDVATIIRPLGLHRRRASYIVAMSSRFAEGGCPVEDLPGVGRYALDAWAIFVEGRTDGEPADGHLNRYVDWRKATGTW